MDTPENAYDAAEYVTKQLGLPDHFVLGLLKEDDWSFIIKTHALLEAAVIRAIENQLCGHSISKFLEQLSMSRCLDFAKELQAIEPRLLSMIRLVSRIRNDIVHDVTKFSFSFTEYLSNQDKRNSFQCLFLQGISGTVDIDGKNIERKELLIENPKLAVIRFLLELLVEVYLQESKGILKSAHLGLGESLFKMLNRMGTNDG